MTTESPEPRYPTLARWLRGSKETHPLRFVVDESEAAWAPIAESYEEMLSFLDALNPLRIDRKRRDFARNENGVLELRTELLVGSLLWKGEVDFELGGEGQRARTTHNVADNRHE